MPSLLSPPPILDATRREFLALLGSAGLLTACGTPTTAPVDAARRVTDRLGRTVDVPAAPQRVVVLDPNRAIADVVALGIVPVGATTNSSNPGSGFSPFLGDAAADIATVGPTGQADLERVAALDPDLILFATAYQDLDVDTLSAIAPVVAYEAASFGLLEPVRWLGEVLGREAEAARLEREFADLITARRSELRLDGQRAAVVSLYNPEAITSVYVFGRDQGACQVLRELGAGYAPQRLGDAPSTEVAAELVTTELAEADLLLALRYGGTAGSEANLTTFTSSPLWQAVPAVAAGRVAYLDVQEANGNYGLAGIDAALDDLVAQLGTRTS